MLGAVIKPVIPPDNTGEQQSAHPTRRLLEHFTNPRENVLNTSFRNKQILFNDKKELKGTKKK
jgi:hypothetical protein